VYLITRDLPKLGMTVTDTPTYGNQTRPWQGAIRSTADRFFLDCDQKPITGCSVFI